MDRLAFTTVSMGLLLVGAAAGCWRGGAAERSEEYPAAVLPADAPPGGDELARLRLENAELRAQLEMHLPLGDRLEAKIAEELAALELRLGEDNNRLRNELNAMAQAVAQSLLADEAKYNRYIGAGVLLQEEADFSGAVVEFSKAIALKPDVFAGYINRGVAYQDLGQWALALADLEMARQLAPDNFTPWNNVAWILATCPDERFREGERAVEYAQRACELTDWENYAALSTLAAAHAEEGDFEQAVERIEQSVEHSPEAIRPQLFEMFEAFKAESPYRSPHP